MAVIFQGTDGERSDAEVYRSDRALADLAEPLGFESIWGVEHHFTSYTMCPDVLQFLSYMAGRTTTAQLGSMVVVLPWHDPIRVAEEVSMLDQLSDGRFVLGIGRGLGRVEFGGFRIPMEESRERFVEAAEMILESLERGYMKYEGTYYQQPERALRPAPLRSFRGRTYAAAVSPESSRIMAELGIGILIIPQKPWESMVEELEAYRTVFRDVNKVEAPPPIVAGWVFCDDDAARAEKMGKLYIGNYYKTVLRHYELAAGHLENTKGYEYYGNVTKHLNDEGMQDAAIDFFADLQVYGTPEQCVEKIRRITEMTGGETFTAVFSYGDMPPEEAERNMRLFADKVAPALRGES
jgi:alkanesulfonate monooxygenase SsuD/methylene tetrahydromethanopterin reductase-like flavin-dependent oxidoreductase (luciferase family)